MKILLPAGFMIGGEAKFLSVAICADGSGLQKRMIIAVPMHKNAHEKQGDMAKYSPVCAFSSLAMTALGGADELLLALALAFILALGLAKIGGFSPSQRDYLRPPLRGPPLYI